MTQAKHEPAFVHSAPPNGEVASPAPLSDECSIEGSARPARPSHTPGPWVVIPRDESSGRSVGTVEPKPETMMGTNYWTVADVNSLRAQWQANLRLIAAAPDLLAALIALRRAELEEMASGYDDIIALRKQADAAIDKATGRAAIERANS